MAKFDTTTIANRSIRGIFTLTSFQLINTILVFLLTIFIDPRTFGVYLVVSASLAFLAYFSDIGLAAALVQKKDKLTQEDLATTFTIQQLLVIAVLVVGFFSTSFIADFYDLDKPGIQLFQALLFSFFLSSLKTIPSIILERNLEFQKVVIPQILEALVFNIVAILFFFKGLGITSFTFAVLARGIVGVVAIYLIAPWRISIGISKTSARKLLSYGLPFQTNSLLALVKDDLLIILLGKILSLTEVGFIGFAQKWAFVPLRLVMDKLIRVTFPAFSRLQEDSKNLKIAIEKTMLSASFVIMPSIIGIIILAPYAIDIIPKYSKWEAALPSLTFFAITAILSSISTPLTNILNAIGKIKVTLWLMTFWVVATWSVTLLLVQFVGFIGVSLASTIVSVSVILVVYLVKRYIDFDIVRPIILPLFSAVTMGGILYFSAPVLVRDIFSLLLAIFLGVAIYLGILFLIAQRELKSDIKLILKHLRSSSSQL